MKIKLSSRSKTLIFSTIVATLSLVAVFCLIRFPKRYDFDYLWQRYIPRKEVEEEIKRRSPPPDVLKENPTLAEIEADLRYDQEWETERVWEGEFHFSIDHPKSWEVIVTRPMVRVHRPCREVCPTFYITADPRGRGTNDPKQHPDIKVILDPENNYEILEEGYTVVGGRKTYTVRVEHPSISGAKSPVRQRFYYILTDNLIYKIEYLEYSESGNVYLREGEWVHGDAFSRMVESLKFYN